MSADLLLAFFIFFPCIGAIAAAFALKSKAHSYLSDAVVVVEFLACAGTFAAFAATAGEGEVLSLTIPGICGMGLHFTMDGFRLLYTLIAAFMWMMTTLLTKEYMGHHAHTGRFYLFMLLTLSMTMGVFLSADLYTMFIFFEGMSLTSYVWVAQEETKGALRAAGTYLAIAVIGGLVMLLGLFGLYHILGTLSISELGAAASACENKGALYALGTCLLVGFGAKAGAFPLHVWLPKAHPVAPAPASALLSGILTKAGVLGILITSSGLFFADTNWGTLLLILGAATMFGGALLAVFSVDLKRTLACSSMSQIGFILIGVGMMCMLGEESALAVHGTILHMANHSLIKLLLFIAAGVIYMNVHALNLNEIRGFGRKKPLLLASFLIGALAIGGIPFFGGYISKTLLHESILEYGGGIAFTLLGYLFLFTGGLTIAYMTKLFVAIFIEENEDPKKQKEFDEKKKYMNGASAFALVGSAAVLLIWGLFPHGIMDRAAELTQGFLGLKDFGGRVAYFSWSNLRGALICILIGAAVYAFIRLCLMKKEEDGIRVYLNRWPAWWDTENLIYRPLLLTILPTLCGIVCRFLDSLLDWCVVGLRKSIYRDSEISHELTEGTYFTKIWGSILNFLQMIGNATVNRLEPKYEDHCHTLALRRQVRRESSQQITRSLSFGLLMAGLGLCLVLAYMLLE